MFEFRELLLFICGLFGFGRGNFPVYSEAKDSACNVGDLGSGSELGKSPGKRNGYPLQCSCLENPKDRGAWSATVQGVTKNWTQLIN